MALGVSTLLCYQRRGVGGHRRPTISVKKHLCEQDTAMKQVPSPDEQFGTIGRKSCFLWRKR